MTPLFDTARVPASALTIDTSTGIYENAGIIHNLALQANNEMYRSFGLDFDGPIVGQVVNDIAARAEAASVLPTGSAAIIAGGVAQFLASTDFDSA
jgi:hypothetical protein